MNVQAVVGVLSDIDSCGEVEDNLEWDCENAFESDKKNVNDNDEGGAGEW